MAEQPQQTNKEEKIQIEGITGPIDLETLRKIKQLCERYGKERVKRLVSDAASEAA